MNADVKAKWIAALRSGEYEQGRRRLRTGDAYCCLGVLCDLYRKEEGTGDWFVSRGPLFVFTDGDFEAETLLPRGVREWADLEVDDPPVILQDGRRSSLAVINDGFGVRKSFSQFRPKGITPRSFAKIADLIEAQL